MRNNKKLTTSEFIAAATGVHGDLYDYSKTEYLGSTTPLTIICRQHGEFQQLAYVHLRGSGCVRCVQAKRIEEAGTALLAKLRNQYKDRYDLSKLIYTGVLDPVILGCQTHGEFSITPASLLAGHGCPICGKVARGKAVSERTGWNISTKELIEKFIAAHGELYDYSKANYLGRDKKLEIICRAHGTFWQRAIDHLRGQGCPECGKIVSKNNRAYTTAEFLGLVKDRFKAKYGLSKVVYTRGKASVTVVCPEHGEFSVVAERLLNSDTEDLCQKCFREGRKYSQAEFLAKARLVHGDRYNYAMTKYTSAHATVTIGCKIHGNFEQMAYAHLAGKGCSKCNLGEGAKQRLESAAEKFPQEAGNLHKNRYDYSKVEYAGVRTPVTVVCPEHGDFLVAPGAHLHGAGCKKCSSGKSSVELELSRYLTDLEIPHELRDRGVIPPKELDIVIPSHRLAIEYCGLYWHRSDNPSSRQWSDAGIKPTTYHLDKLLACEAANYRLITIFEDEWLENKDLVKMLLRRATLRGQLSAVGARQCSVVEVAPQEARAFYSLHHLQGFTGAKCHIGLVRLGELLALGSFVPPRAIFGGVKAQNSLELVRFAQKSGVIVHGALNKIVTRVHCKQPDITSILSYVDRRWFTGETYLRAGFTAEHTSPPGYWYTLGQTRMSRFGFSKGRLEKKLENYDPMLTERKNVLANGYSVIYDCGHIKMVKQF